MNAVLAALVAELAGTEAAAAHARIAAFLREQPCPVVDPDGVTFVWHGEADAVLLRLWVSGLPAAQPLVRVEGAPLWLLRLDLPAGSRVEYKFEVVRHGHGEWVTDPLNPVLAADPFGANSVVQAYGYVQPEWTQRSPDARRGLLDGLAVPSAAFGGTRDVRVYLPARFRRSRRYPLLVVHDGDDYLRYAGLQDILDTLIHRLEVAPMIVALTSSPSRLTEYVGVDAHADFIAREVLPALAQRLPLDEGPAARGLMGASLGGVASLHTAWRHPDTFGRLLLQSGSFAFTDIGENRRGPVFEPVVQFMNAFRRAPGCPAERAYLSCGIYEGLIYENRSLLPLLTAQGMDVRFEEARDGHNWQNWRDRLRTALAFLFPGPLWMVYE